jgi:hypothetical protein
MDKITNEICHGCGFYDPKNIKCVAVSCTKITGNYLKIHEIIKEIYGDGYKDGYNKAYSEIKDKIEPIREIIKVIDL